MPSFSDSIFIFILALMLFGPKKLPQLARQLGKLMAEFRRASNEFRMQMEDELRMEEQKEHQKKVEAMAGPPSTLPETEHAHLPSAEAIEPAEAASAEATEPMPIAEAGDLKMMPPSTGLPVERAAHAVTVAEENTILPPSTYGASSEEPSAVSAGGEHAAKARRRRSKRRPANTTAQVSALV